MKYDVIEHPKGIIKVRKGYHGNKECWVFSVRRKDGFTFHGVTERTSVPWFRGRGFAYRYNSDYDEGLKLSREYLDRARASEDKQPNDGRCSNCGGFLRYWNHKLSCVDCGAIEGDYFE